MNKGTVEAGSALTNQYALELSGMPTIYFTRVGELDVQLVKAKMADLTWQTTGQVNPLETEVDQYLHHSSERVAMEAWFAACVAGSPAHKKTGLLYFNGADGQPVASFMLDGVLNCGPKYPELKAMDDGEGVVITWKLAVDNVVPV